MTALPLSAESESAQERTKTRLLELLKRHGPQTAQDLATRLQITTPAARRHLSDLQLQALVNAQVEKPGGRGRPQYVFALTEQGDDQMFPRTYAALCLDVLKYVAELYGEDAPFKVLQRRSEYLGEILKIQIPAELPLQEKLERLVGPLKEMGFDARLEQQDGQWYLVQGNCPTLQIARCFKSICLTELQMYEDLLGVPLEREEHIACGQSNCRYRIAAVQPS